MKMEWPHPSYRTSMRNMAGFLLTLASIQLLAWLLPTWPNSKGIPNYLPIHTLMETVSIVVSMMVFAVGWNSHNRSLSGNIVLLASVFFSVGVLDFLHMVSYGGMPDFISTNNAQKHLDFWLFARLFAAISLLAVSIRPWKPLATNTTRYFIFCLLIIATLMIYWSVMYHQDWFPNTFIPDLGLTTFKKAIEYLIIAVNVFTATKLLVMMRKRQSFNIVLLFGAVCTLAMSEFFFTLYTTMIGSYNVLGHIYKVIAYLLIYRAIVVEVIEEPYSLLQRVMQKFRALFDSAKDCMLLISMDGCIVDINPSGHLRLGYTREEMLGRKISEFVAAEFTSKVPERIAEILFKGHATFESVHLCKDGAKMPVEINCRMIELSEQRLLYSVIRDITERKNAEEQIENLAFYDQLTELPNRQLLHERLNHAMVAGERNGRLGALLIIDLDNFKAINDTHGHRIGDLLLQQAANRLKSCIRESDTVARIGGDEFVILLEDLNNKVVEAAAQTEYVVEKILNISNEPYQIEAHEFRSSSSIGVTLFSGHQLSIDELMKQADIAMYQAKKAGRNTLRFFDPAMQETINRRAAMERELYNALEKQQFHLYYQIQVDSSRHPIGAEALIRWIHPERGMVSPADFIPLAEETGLILPIGNWVLDSACKQLKAWQDDPDTRDLVLAVNVSAKQFRRDDFVSHVQRALLFTGAQPSNLKLELTESTVLENVEDAIAKMRDLKQTGVSFSMDDFGTGYSSLQYLKRLPLDQIKIDQSFVRDISTDPSDAAIVGAIIAMTKELELEVIAEGVETEAQLEFLESRGCNAFQGYLFSRPMPNEQFKAVLNHGLTIK
jgi:diguanylate cyclase (GGDEF)-like protein/PAS domain S-box-containing protein